ncbi:MAG: hypothetical protein HY812_09065 [Planctomycetes bacterium]|nr:hypothetical protein [Planctomycetota bacterium]
MRTSSFCLPIALLLLAGLARAETTVARVTLQVRNEPGYSAAEVAAFLADPAYLGSVRAGMVPVASQAADVFPHEVLVLTVATPGREILTLDLRGADKEAVAAGMEVLLAHLKSIVPSDRVLAREHLDAARREYEEAAEAYSRAHAALQSFVEQHVALDPEARLAQVRGSLMDQASMLQSLDLDLAGQRALRDYLVEAIAREPAEVMAGSAPVDIASLEESIERARSQLTALEAEFKEPIPEINRKRAELKTLETMFVSARAAWPRPNPRRADLERELFSVERDLVLAESRRACLAEGVAKEQQEATQLALLAQEYQELKEALGWAEARVQHARDRLDQASRPAHVGEWLQVIAGPTVTEEPAGG